MERLFALPFFKAIAMTRDPKKPGGDETMKRLGGSFTSDFDKRSNYGVGHSALFISLRLAMLK